MSESIFKEYYKKQKFIDRYEIDSSEEIEVIIPVYHTNELWEANLRSIFREIPVKRLLISDGGVIDNSLDILKKFPRVEIYDHTKYKTLGKCIAELIKSVETEHFIYLHSDVYLPENWFDKMIKYKSDYDWYGCPMNITVLVNYRLNEPNRPYAGSQIGKKTAFKNIDKIDDDYVYRQEDFIFNQLVTDAGFKTGKVEDIFHYHQVMFRRSSGYDVNVTNVNIENKRSDSEWSRTRYMQLRGIVKYLDPIETWVIDEFKITAKFMLNDGSISYSGFRDWIKTTNDKWLKYFNLKLIIRLKVENQIPKLKKLIKKLF